MPSSRAKPTSVTLARRARSTASDDAAGTDATSGMPAAIAFLDDLEARTAADDEEMTSERQRIGAHP